MLMRFDPLREFDRVFEQAWSQTRQASVPMDAYRHGDSFVIQSRLARSRSRIDRSDRRTQRHDHQRRTALAARRRRPGRRQRTPAGHVHSSALPRRRPRHRAGRRQLRERRADGHGADRATAPSPGASKSPARRAAKRSTQPAPDPALGVGVAVESAAPPLVDDIDRASRDWRVRDRGGGGFLTTKPSEGWGRTLPQRHCESKRFTGTAPGESRSSARST